MEFINAFIGFVDLEALHVRLFHGTDICFCCTSETVLMGITGTDTVDFGGRLASDRVD